MTVVSLVAAVFAATAGAVFLIAYGTVMDRSNPVAQNAFWGGVVFAVLAAGGVALQLGFPGLHGVTMAVGYAFGGVIFVWRTRIMARLRREGRDQDS